MSHNLSSCKPLRENRKLFVSLLMTLLVGQHIRQSSLYSCNSDSEMLAALQTVEETLVVPKDIVSTPISFRCSRLVGLGKGFVATWISVGLSSGLLLVRNYLEVYWPRAGGLSAVDAIGTQLRYRINSGLTR